MTSSRCRIGRVGAISPRITPRGWRAARLVEGEPQRDAEHDVDRDGRTPRRRRTATTTTSAGGDGRRAEVDAVRVEDRDHDDRADVVDDREREQEQLERRRAPASPSRLTTPTAMAMSVAIGMPQPSRAGPAGVDRDVDRAPARACPPTAAIGGQRRPARLAQLALDELPLDLQPDDEEEDRHQPVVDPLRRVSEME